MSKEKDTMGKDQLKIVTTTPPATIAACWTSQKKLQKFADDSIMWSRSHMQYLARQSGWKSRRKVPNSSSGPRRSSSITKQLAS